MFQKVQHHQPSQHYSQSLLLHQDFRLLKRCCKGSLMTWRLLTHFLFFFEAFDISPHCVLVFAPSLRSVPILFLKSHCQPHGRSRIDDREELKCMLCLYNQERNKNYRKKMVDDERKHIYMYISERMMVDYLTSRIHFL